MLKIFSGVVIDLILGDNENRPHPVRWIGRGIEITEDFLRTRVSRYFSLRVCGIFLTILITMGVFVIAWSFLNILAKIHPWLRSTFEVILIYQCISLRSLIDETKKNYFLLKAGDLPGARGQLSRLVTRETSCMSEEKIVLSTIETLAENLSDGVIAPLFYILLGGALGGITYKAINTLDSMVGYRNDRYRELGWASARLDDVVNFIPARLSALMVIVSAFVLRLDGKNAIRIFLRDRRKHESPNGGCPESAMAGTLGIRMGGDFRYFGNPVHHQMIGDPHNPPHAELILSAIRILYVSTAIFLIMSAAM